MTGYGGAKGTAQGLELSIELKSVNNRFLDTSVRIPRAYLFAEETVKAAVGRHITRGKVDVFVSVDSSQVDDVVVKVNEPSIMHFSYKRYLENALRKSFDFSGTPIRIMVRANNEK